MARRHGLTANSTFRKPAPISCDDCRLIGGGAAYHEGGRILRETSTGSIAGKPGPSHAQGVLSFSVAYGVAKFLGFRETILNGLDLGSYRLPSAYIAAVVALCSVALGILVPVYTDEVGWRFQARMALDGGVDRFVAENCGANTLAAPPSFIKPVRYFSTAFNTAFADPLYIRLTGIMCALAWMALLWCLIGQLSRTRTESNTLRVIAFSLASLGLLPFILVISRPEQPILLALTAAIFIATAGFNKGPLAEDKAATAAIKAALVTGLGAIALSYHLKGIIFMPIFLTAAAFSSHGMRGRWYRVAAISSLIGMTIISIPYWVGRFRCPSDVALAAKLGRENIASVIFNANPATPNLGKMIGRIEPFEYILLTMPKMKNMANWLPPHVIGHGPALAWTILIMICWVACMLASIGALIAIARPIPNDSRNTRKILFALLILSTVTVWSVAQINKNVYESALAVPLIIVFFILAATSAQEFGILQLLIGKMSKMILGCAAISAVLLASYYWPALSNIARSAGYVSQQKGSVSVFGYGSIRDDIIEAGKLCGISDDMNTQGLLVDDLTYIAYMKTWRPLHRTGVLSDWNGSISDPGAYLRAHKSSGAVIGCRYLPPALLGHARRIGSYCCLDARF